MQDAAASYLIGALGGIAYLRMLHRSVASIGATGFGGVASGMLAQPRLLIPVVLTLFFNRCALSAVHAHTRLWPAYAWLITAESVLLFLANCPEPGCSWQRMPRGEFRYYHARLRIHWVTPIHRAKPPC